MLSKAEISKHGLAPIQSSDSEEAAYKISDILSQAVDLGHSIAAGETRALSIGSGLGGFKDFAARAAQIVSGVISALASKVQSLFAGFGTDEIDESDIEDAESTLSDWVDSYVETVATTEITAAIEETVYEDFVAQDVPQIVWVASPDACPICQENADASPLPIGSEWPSGDSYPPGHPRCRCHLSTV